MNMTNQQVFEKVRAHLLAQKRRSTILGTPALRGNDGLKSAAGCLIVEKECPWYLSYNYDYVMSQGVQRALMASGVDTEDVSTSSSH